jgi:hypothetical protein
VKIWLIVAITGVLVLPAATWQAQHRPTTIF